VPRFPLFEAPRCRRPRCGLVCELYPRTETRRPYWKCTCGKFCTFDDLAGIVRENPLCDCGFYSRKTVKGDGRTFESCAFGKCDMQHHKALSRESSSGATRYVPSAGPSSPATRRLLPVETSSGAAPLDNRPDGEFTRLLRHVLAVVAQTSFPTRVAGMSDQARSRTDSANPSPAFFRLRASTEFERHAKVGAAGELFVSRSQSANYTVGQEFQQSQMLTNLA
jgi:hypothetical protein